MISWFKYPFIRLLVPFALGICLAFYFDGILFQKKTVLLLLIFLSLLFVLLFMTSKWIKSYGFRWVFSTILFIYLLLIGFFIVKVNVYKLEVTGLYALDKNCRCYLARLSDCPTIKEKSIKVMLDVYGIVLDDDIKSVDSKIVAYFDKSEKSLNLKYGDCVLIIEPPVEVEKPPNPEQFDYKDYLYKKGITHQVYLKSDNWINLGYNRSNPIYRFSYYIRDFLLETMSCLGVQNDEYAVAAAILLGYDDSLPYDLRQKYVAAGAMHILCVSGLHVGVIFMVFSYMLFFLNDSKKLQRFVKQILLLFLIWFYAMLAGLASSILRATIMLSFVIIGNIINRKGVLLNSLAASAFILLCVNPANLFDIGFLLSYSAVIGIVVLQKPISKIFYFKYNIFNKIWEITSVAIAAQIVTIPFTIYYFHQFPIYFWLSNLFMTPVSSIVIIGGMIMLLIFFIPYINNIVAFVVSKMIYVMNFGVSWIESLPYSIVKGLYIDELQFFILLLILLAILFFSEFKSVNILIFIMTMTCVFLIMNINNLCKQNAQKEIVIYSINNVTAIDFINGRTHLLMTNSASINDKSIFSYNIENFLVSRGVFQNGKTKLLVEDFDEDFVKKLNNIVTFDGKIIGLSDGSKYYKEKLDYIISLDYMLVYGRKYQTIKSLLNAYDFDNLIIDGSVPYYLTARLLEEAERLGVKCYDIRNDGAFFIK